MNHPKHYSSEELEHLTSPSAINGGTRPEASSNEEKAELRETWLALSDVLKSLTPAMDERAIVASVLAREKRKSARVWLGLGLAACLILGMLAAWPALRSAMDQRVTPPVANNFPGTPATSPATLPATYAQSNLSWDDNLQRRLLDVRRDVSRLKAQPVAVNRHAERVDTLRLRIHALQREWSANHL